jgi:hypothetical protein
MRTTTMRTTDLSLELAPAVRAWRHSTVQLLKAVAQTAWEGLCAVTKARLLTENGAYARRPLRRF